jgi:hypothetical protein
MEHPYEAASTTWKHPGPAMLERPLGVVDPLLVPIPLGQSFLSAKFLYPVGAQTLQVVNPEVFFAEGVPGYSRATDFGNGISFNHPRRYSFAQPSSASPGIQRQQPMIPVESGEGDWVRFSGDRSFSSIDQSEAPDPRLPYESAVEPLTVQRSPQKDTSLLLPSGAEAIPSERGTFQNHQSDQNYLPETQAEQDASFTPPDQSSHQAAPELPHAPPADEIQTVLRHESPPPVIDRLPSQPGSGVEAPLQTSTEASVEAQSRPASTSSPAFAPPVPLSEQPPQEPVGQQSSAPIPSMPSVQRSEEPPTVDETTAVQPDSLPSTILGGDPPRSTSLLTFPVEVSSISRKVFAAEPLSKEPTPSSGRLLENISLPTQVSQEVLSSPDVSPTLATAQPKQTQPESVQPPLPQISVPGISIQTKIQPIAESPIVEHPPVASPVVATDVSALPDTSTPSVQRLSDLSVAASTPLAQRASDPVLPLVSMVSGSLPANPTAIGADPPASVDDRLPSQPGSGVEAPLQTSTEASVEAQSRPASTSSPAFAPPVPLSEQPPQEPVGQQSSAPIPSMPSMQRSEEPPAPNETPAVQPSLLPSTIPADGAADSIVDFATKRITSDSSRTTADSESSVKDLTGGSPQSASLPALPVEVSRVSRKVLDPSEASFEELATSGQLPGVLQPAQSQEVSSPGPDISLESTEVQPQQIQPQSMPLPLAQSVSAATIQTKIQAVSPVDEYSPVVSSEIMEPAVEPKAGASVDPEALAPLQDHTDRASEFASAAPNEQSTPAVQPPSPELQPKNIKTPSAEASDPAVSLSEPTGVSIQTPTQPIALAADLTPIEPEHSSSVQASSSDSAPSPIAGLPPLQQASSAMPLVLPSTPPRLSPLGKPEIETQPIALNPEERLPDAIRTADPAVLPIESGEQFVPDATLVHHVLKPGLDARTKLSPVEAHLPNVADTVLSPKVQAANPATGHGLSILPPAAISAAAETAGPLVENETRPSAVPHSLDGLQRLTEPTIQPAAPSQIEHLPETQQVNAVPPAALPSTSDQAVQSSTDEKSVLPTVPATDTPAPPSIRRSPEVPVVQAAPVTARAPLPALSVAKHNSPYSNSPESDDEFSPLNFGDEGHPAPILQRSEESPVPVVQRREAAPASPAQPAQQAPQPSKPEVEKGDSQADLDRLADAIYGLLCQRLEIERERQGIFNGRLPW